MWMVSFLDATCNAGIVVVVRNAEGFLVDGFCGLVRAHSTTDTEALADKKACEMVLSLEARGAIIESNCQDIINAMKANGVGADWRCVATVIDVVALSKCLSDVCFSFNFLLETRRKLLI